MINVAKQGKKKYKNSGICYLDSITVWEELNSISCSVYRGRY